MTVSLDGFINDRDGGIDWSEPGDELFEFHLDRVRELSGTLLGRKLYETMLVWETDPSLRSTPAFIAFADAWTALPKVVFSHTLSAVQGNARLATESLEQEASQMLAGGGDVEVGGATLASQALALDLIDDFRLFRAPVILGGGTPFPPEVQNPMFLELVESRTFEPGIVYEHYRRSPASS